MFHCQLKETARNERRTVPNPWVLNLCKRKESAVSVKKIPHYRKSYRPVPLLQNLGGGWYECVLHTWLSSCIDVMLLVSCGRSPGRMRDRCPSRWGVWRPDMEGTDEKVSGHLTVALCLQTLPGYPSKLACDILLVMNILVCDGYPFLW